MWVIATALSTSRPWASRLLWLMPKAQPLYTGAELNLGDKVLGEVEKNSFIALPGKVGHSGLLPQKTTYPNPGGFDEEFYSNSSRVGFLTRLGCVQGLYSFNLISGSLLILMSFSGPFNLASGGFLAAPPLTINCLNLPSGTQRRSWRLESCLQTRNGGQKGFHGQEPLSHARNHLDSEKSSPKEKINAIDFIQHLQFFK